MAENICVVYELQTASSLSGGSRGPQLALNSIYGFIKSYFLGCTFANDHLQQSTSPA